MFHEEFRQNYLLLSEEKSRTSRKFRRKKTINCIHILALLHIGKLKTEGYRHFSYYPEYSAKGKLFAVHFCFIYKSFAAFMWVSFRQMERLK